MNSWLLGQRSNNALLLPPCVPQSNKVIDISKEHPFVVQGSICFTDNADAQTPGDKTFERQIDLLLWPEFKTPTAIAASSGSADKGASGSAEAEAVKLMCSNDESEALHRFCAVRGLTTDELQKEKDHLTQRMKQSGGNYQFSIAN